VPSPGKLYSTLMDLIVRFAKAGLIHGDFNEFNILIRRNTGEPVVIDFPQMVSTSHENAEWYFNRDVECIRTFFRRRFQYESSLYPRFCKVLSEGTQSNSFRLDVVVEASGFGRKDMKILEEYMENAKEDEPPNETDEEMVEEDDESQGDSSLSNENMQDAIENEEVQVEALSVSEAVVPNGTSVSVGKCRKTDPGCSRRSISPARSDLSRSPPRSRSVSPSTLEKMLTALDLNDVKNKVASEMSKSVAKERRKYHSKRSTRKAGRPQGSKAKQDVRVKPDCHGVWS